MNRLGLFFAVSISLCAAAPVALAQNPGSKGTQGEARGVVIADHLQTKAVVEEIDYADRTAVLKAEDGQTITLKVGPAAKNFDQVKVGDQVTVDFFASTAIFLRKSNEPPSAASVDTVELAAAGEKPGGVITSTREMSAKVDAVDPQNRWIIVTGPRGNSVGFHVSDEVQNLSDIKPGDQIVLRYTQAIALHVEKS